MNRKCPYCGEEVPSFSINCPKCYRSIPRNEYKIREDIRNEGVPNDRAPSIVTFNKKLVLFLALIPAAFGLFGLGQIYEREYGKGATFLVAGLLLFITIVSLITNLDSFGSGKFLAVSAVIFCLILFIIGYVIQAFDAIVRSLIPVSLRF